MPPSHPLFRLSTVFLSCQLLSPCSGRAACGVCSPPSVQSTAPLQLSSRGSQSSRAVGAARGESKQPGSDPSAGSCFPPMMTMVVVVVVVMTITATGRELLPEPGSSHAFTHLIFTAARGDETRLRGCQGHTDSTGRSHGQTGQNGFYPLLCSFIIAGESPHS